MSGHFFTFEGVCNEHKVRPKGVIHVGANTGQELGMYNAMGVANVVWIEANPDIVPDLRKMVENQKGHTVVEALVSARSGEKKQFNVTNNLQSSSYLELGTHKLVHPTIHVTKIMELQTRTLPEVVPDLQLYDTLNLDVQGAELDVLLGLGDKLSQFQYIYSEVNTAHVYKECGLLTQIDQHLAKYQFERVALFIFPNSDYGEAFYIKKK